MQNARRSHSLPSWDDFCLKIRAARPSADSLSPRRFRVDPVIERLGVRQRINSTSRLETSSLVVSVNVTDQLFSWNSRDGPIPTFSLDKAKVHVRESNHRIETYGSAFARCTFPTPRWYSRCRGRQFGGYPMYGASYFISSLICLVHLRSGPIP